MEQNRQPTAYRQEQNGPVQLPPRRNPMPTYRKPVQDGVSMPRRPVGYEDWQAYHAASEPAYEPLSSSVHPVPPRPRPGAEVLAGQGYPAPPVRRIPTPGEAPAQVVVQRPVVQEPMGYSQQYAPNVRGDSARLYTGQAMPVGQPVSSSSSRFGYSAVQPWSGGDMGHNGSTPPPVQPRPSVEPAPPAADKPRTPHDKPARSMEDGGVQASSRYAATGQRSRDKSAPDYADAFRELGGIPGQEAEDPDVDPSLARSRSKNVYAHDDPFWKPLPGQQTAPQPKPVSRTGSHALLMLVLIVVVLVAVGLLLNGTVFRVRTITVEGSHTMADAEIISVSGIAEGDSTLSLSEDKVAAAFAGNRYIAFLGMEKDLPDSVVLHIRQRVPAAVFNYCGIDYTVDNQGMVLEESEDTDVLHDVPEIRGLSVKECRMGRKLTLSKTGQMDLLCKLLVELRVMGMQQMVTQINLSDLSSIYMVTSDGYSVRMGEGKVEDVHAKLRSLDLTRDELNARGYSLGTIDVSNPVYPTYIPEGG